MRFHSACTQNRASSHHSRGLSAGTRLQLHLSVVQGYAETRLASRLVYIVHDVPCRLREEYRIFVNDQNRISRPGFRNHGFASPLPDAFLQRLPGYFGSGVHQPAKPMYVTFKHAESVRACRPRDTLDFAPRPRVTHDVHAVDALEIGGIHPANHVRQNGVQQIMRGWWQRANGLECRFARPKEPLTPLPADSVVMDVAE